MWNCWIIFKLACGLQGFNLGGQILGNLGDIVEGSPLVHWDGLEGDDELDRVVAFGEVESVQNRGQPWVEIVG